MTVDPVEIINRFTEYAPHRGEEPLPLPIPGYWFRKICGLAERIARAENESAELRIELHNAQADAAAFRAEMERAQREAEHLRGELRGLARQINHALGGAEQEAG